MVPISGSKEPTSSGWDTIIVGGGLAGLTTAVGLSDAGQRVCVLEADAILGGRARGWRDPTTGDPISIGPHVFVRDYPNLLRLLKRLGTEHRVLWQRVPEFSMVDGARVRTIRDTALPAPFNVAQMALSDPQLNLGAVARNLPASLLVLLLDERDVLALDEIPASELLSSLGVPQSSQRAVWAFVANSILNVPLDQCSSGSLLRFCSYLISHPTMHFGFADGALGDVFAPAASALVQRAGGAVMTGAKVEALLGTERPAGVRLADGRKLHAPRVVMTLPADGTHALLPARWRRRDRGLEALSHFSPSPYISVYLWFDRKLTYRQFWARTYQPEDLSCDFYDLSNIHRGWGARPSLITTNIIYSHRAHQLDDDAVIAGVRAELSEFIPEAAHANVIHARVHRIPMAIHAPTPGTERRRPPNRTGVPGLYLAADWTRTELPFCMESAVRSGWLATEELLVDAGKARPQLAIKDEAGLLQRLARSAAGSLPRSPGQLIGKWLGASG